MTKDLTTGGFALPCVSLNKMVVLSAVLNCQTNNLAAGDVALLIPVPAGSMVGAVAAIVETEEGGTLTIDVGAFKEDGTEIDADGFLDGVNANVAGAKVGGGALATGYVFEEDGYIGVTAVNAADAAVIKVSAPAYDVS